MPSVYFHDNSFPEKSREVFYEYDDESLETLVSKYDFNLTSKDTRCAFGTNVILDWRLPIMTCLSYGDTISIYKYKSEIAFVDVTGRVKDKLILEVANDMPVYSLIDKVSDALYSALKQDGVRITDLEIIFSSFNIHEAEHVTKTVKELGIRHGDALPVRYNIFDDNRRIIVNVKNLEETIATIYCEQDCKIRALKEQVHAQEGIAPDQQNLIFAGKHLDDEQSLKYYDVKNKASVYLVVRLPGQSSLDFVDVEKVN